MDHFYHYPAHMSQASPLSVLVDKGGTGFIPYLSIQRNESLHKGERVVSVGMIHI